MIREFRKHIMIWFLFIKNGVIAQLEYRVNFFTGMAMEIGYLFAKLLYVIVIYNAGVEINGMTADEVLVFVGVFVMLTAFYTGFFMLNNFALSDHIRKGTLDFYITKPVSLQFIATLRNSNFALFVTNFTAGLIIITVGLSRLQTPIDVLSLLGFCGFMLCGIIVSYALLLFPIIFSFWFYKSDALASVVDSFWDFNNMPMGIYNKLIQRIGIYLLPVFVVVNFPTLFILGKLEPIYAIWGIIAPIVCFLVTRLLWKVAERRYSSASS